MATCKASGKVTKHGPRKPFNRKRHKSNIKTNKHRLFTVKQKRGFHKESLQMTMHRAGISERYHVDLNGTIKRIKDEIWIDEAKDLNL